VSVSATVDASRSASGQALETLAEILATFSSESALDDARRNLSLYL
jgi:hypothetical protein